MSSKALMTVDQFAQMRTTDTEDYELVEGELIPLSSGTPRHAEIRDLTGDFIRSYFRNNPIGRAYAEIDCQLAPDEVRRPDISIFLGERLSRIDLDKIPAPVAPDIAIEILSPSEGAIDLRHKVRGYLRAGSKEVWLLDHSNGEVQVNKEDGVRILAEADVLESPLLPGFRVRVSDVLLPS